MWHRLAHQGTLSADPSINAIGLPRVDLPLVGEMAGRPEGGAAPLPQCVYMPVSTAQPLDYLKI